MQRPHPSPVHGYASGRKDGMRPTFERAFLHQVCDMDTERGQALARELLDLFLQHATPLVDALEDARLPHDFLLVLDSLHRLYGSSASLGGHHLADLCAHLEAQLAQAAMPDLTAQLTAIRDEYGRLVAALRAERARLR